MSKFHFFCVLILNVSFVPAFCNEEKTIELGHLFDQDVTTWYEISYRCSELVPYFYEKAEQDSLSYILQYWEQETNVMEPIRRVWTLDQIALKTFESEFINETMVDDFINYLVQIEQQGDSAEWRVDGKSKDKNQPKYISSDFNTFTISLANQLLQYTDLSDDEYLICLFYGHHFDEFWRLLKSGEARYTTLAKNVERYRRRQEGVDLHYGFFLGYYSPRKSFLRFGQKANVGGTFGLDWQRVIFDVSLLFQFPNSKESYSVVYEKEVFETKHYFRFYLGLEPAFRLYDWGHTRINLLSGLGVDVVEAVPELENPYYEEPISMSGVNLNLGIGVQHVLKKGVPWTIQYQIRYEFSGYDTNGGTDLSNGEALSVRLGVSWDSNKRKHEFKKYFD